VAVVVVVKMVLLLRFGAVGMALVGGAVGMALVLCSWRWLAALSLWRWRLLWLRGGRRFRSDGAAGGLLAEAIEDPKKKQAMLRKTKVGIKAWAKPAKASVLVTAAAATVAELQQHGDKLKAAPEDAALTSPPLSARPAMPLVAAVARSKPWAKTARQLLSPRVLLCRL
jgi:hypothetical protein